jgi:hypothetical protein
MKCNTSRIQSTLHKKGSKGTLQANAALWSETYIKTSNVLLYNFKKFVVLKKSFKYRKLMVIEFWRLDEFQIHVNIK